MIGTILISFRIATTPALEWIKLTSVCTLSVQSALDSQLQRTTAACQYATVYGELQTSLDLSFQTSPDLSFKPKTEAYINLHAFAVNGNVVPTIVPGAAVVLRNACTLHFVATEPAVSLITTRQTRLEVREHFIDARL